MWMCVCDCVSRSVGVVEDVLLGTYVYVHG